jgi:hypothetical protein
MNTIQIIFIDWNYIELCVLEMNVIDLKTAVCLLPVHTVTRTSLSEK